MVSRLGLILSYHVVTQLAQNQSEGETIFILICVFSISAILHCIAETRGFTAASLHT